LSAGAFDATAFVAASPDLGNAKIRIARTRATITGKAISTAISIGGTGDTVGGETDGLAFEVGCVRAAFAIGTIFEAEGFAAISETCEALVCGVGATWGAACAGLAWGITCVFDASPGFGVALERACATNFVGALFGATLACFADFAVLACDTEARRWWAATAIFTEEVIFAGAARTAWLAFGDTGVLFGDDFVAFLSAGAIWCCGVTQFGADLFLFPLDTNEVEFAGVFVEIALFAFFFAVVGWDAVSLAAFGLLADAVFFTAWAVCQTGDAAGPRGFGWIWAEALKARFAVGFSCFAGLAFFGTCVFDAFSTNAERLGGVGALRATATTCFFDAFVVLADGFVGVFAVGICLALNDAIHTCPVLTLVLGVVTTVEVICATSCDAFVVFAFFVAVAVAVFFALGLGDTLAVVAFLNIATIVVCLALCWLFFLALVGVSVAEPVIATIAIFVAFDLDTLVGRSITLCGQLCAVHSALTVAFWLAAGWSQKCNDKNRQHTHPGHIYPAYAPIHEFLLCL
jgi:hypothetical protein